MLKKLSYRLCYIFLSAFLCIYYPNISISATGEDLQVNFITALIDLGQAYRRIDSLQRELDERNNRITYLESTMKKASTDIEAIRTIVEQRYGETGKIIQENRILHSANVLLWDQIIQLLSEGVRDGGQTLSDH